MKSMLSVLAGLLMLVAASSGAQSRWEGVPSTACTVTAMPQSHVAPQGSRSAADRHADLMSHANDAPCLEKWEERGLALWLPDLVIRLPQETVASVTGWRLLTLDKDFVQRDLGLPDQSYITHPFMLALDTKADGASAMLEFEIKYRGLPTVMGDRRASIVKAVGLPDGQVAVSYGWATASDSEVVKRAGYAPNTYYYLHATQLVMTISVAARDRTVESGQQYLADVGGDEGRDVIEDMALMEQAQAMAETEPVSVGLEVTALCSFDERRAREAQAALCDDVYWEDSVESRTRRLREYLKPQRKDPRVEHGMPRLTTCNPYGQTPESTPKAVNIVFVHGVSIFGDYLRRAMGRDINYDEHWWQYAHPGSADHAGTADLPILNRLEKLGGDYCDQVSVWWHYYETVHTPIFNTDGNGRWLAEELREKIIRVRPDADIILAGYSMGGPVCLAAYDYLVDDVYGFGYAPDVIDALITLDGVMLGTEWVNLCLALDRQSRFFVPIPYGAGVMDLRSVYNCSASDLNVTTASPNLELLQLWTKWESKLQDRDWFYPICGGDPRGFHGSWCSGFLDAVLDAPAMFNSIDTYYIVNQSGGDVAPCPAPKSALYQPYIGEDRLMYDGLVPLYSQKAVGISTERDLFPDHTHDHLQVLASPRTEVLSRLQQVISRLVPLLVGGV